jgi:hypothetical protein
MNKASEYEVTETDVNEIIQELETEGETNKQVKYDKCCRSFLLNLKHSWNRVPKKDTMRYRFQQLAGIINNKAIASLTLPSGSRITFDELPHWWDVVRYKICGFKYETYPEQYKSSSELDCG